MALRKVSYQLDDGSRIRSLREISAIHDELAARYE
jgi:hypothetical protein